MKIEGLVMPDDSLSFYEKGLAPISDNWKWYTAQIESLALVLKVDLHTPFEKWPKKASRIADTYAMRT
jgi:excinuclease UvrABC ATPase subunit